MRSVPLSLKETIKRHPQLAHWMRPRPSSIQDVKACTRTWRARTKDRQAEACRAEEDEIDRVKEMIARSTRQMELAQQRLENARRLDLPGSQGIPPLIGSLKAQALCRKESTPEKKGMKPVKGEPGYKVFQEPNNMSAVSASRAPKDNVSPAEAMLKAKQAKTTVNL